MLNKKKKKKLLFIESIDVKPTFEIFNNYYEIYLIHVYICLSILKTSFYRSFKFQLMIV